MKQETHTAKTFVTACASVVALAATPAKAATGLTLFPEGSLLLILLISFIVLVFPVNALLFKPLFRVLDEREKRIVGAREKATVLEAEANELLTRYREAIREVREESERQRRSELEEARSEQVAQSDQARSQAQSVLEQGRVELEGWIAGTRGELEQGAPPLARTVAERVLGRGLS